MAAFRISDRSIQQGYIFFLWFATLFALITYVAISMRAVLSPYEMHHFVDAKRMLSVAIGTLVLWLSIRAADRMSEDAPGAQIFAVLNVAIPGAIGLLVAREAYDLAASGEFAQRFALNLRWMLTWIGYFAAAVAGFLAMAAHRRLQVVIAQGPTNGRNTAMSPTPRAPANYEVADLEFDPRARQKA